MTFTHNTILYTFKEVEKYFNKHILNVFLSRSKTVYLSLWSIEVIDMFSL